MWFINDSCAGSQSMVEPRIEGVWVPVHPVAQLGWGRQRPVVDPVLDGADGHAQHIGFPWRINAKDGAAHSSAFTADQMRAYAIAARTLSEADSLPAGDTTQAQDAARLDWLDKNRASIWSHWTNHAIGIPPTFHGFSVSSDDVPLPTVRAAIDAAIAFQGRNER